MKVTVGRPAFCKLGEVRPQSLVGRSRHDCSGRCLGDNAFILARHLAQDRAETFRDCLEVLAMLFMGTVEIFGDLESLDLPVSAVSNLEVVCCQRLVENFLGQSFLAGRHRGLVRAPPRRIARPASLLPRCLAAGSESISELAFPVLQDTAAGFLAGG